MLRARGSAEVELARLIAIRPRPEGRLARREGLVTWTGGLAMEDGIRIGAAATALGAHRVAGNSREMHVQDDVSVLVSHRW